MQGVMHAAVNCGAAYVPLHTAPHCPLPFLRSSEHRKSEAIGRRLQMAQLDA